MNNLLSMRTFVYTLFGIFFLNITHAQEENRDQTLKDTLSTHTQELTSLERGKEFIIGGIEVAGAKHYNAQTIIVASGLKVGDKITIPSEKFTRIIHKLWDYQVFNDIDIYITKVEGNKVFLEFAIQEMPELVDVQVTGIRKKKGEELLKKAELEPTKLNGKKLNESLIAKTKSYITNKYRKEGYLNTKVHINTQEVDSLGTKVRMLIRVDRGNKVKINHITFEENEKFADAKLRRQLKKTKQRFFGRFWKRSKYVQDKYDEDLTKLIDFYKENGYRDARVTKDTLYDGKENIDLKISLEEGKKYYFGDIKFLGNTVYNNQALSHLLGLKKGEVYNGVQLRNRINDPKNPDANSIANLYQNTGYLFSQINPVETSVVNDTINFEIRIHEGKPAYFNNVSVSGNTITNDKVIYRELRTRPGYLYSKEDVIRTIRELSQLGIFDAQKINPQIKNPDPNSGTVDLEYELDDTSSSSQIQLQGGYGGSGFIGTLGLNFNNFSIQNIFDKKSYRPLPMGDAQKLALNISASRSYRVFSFSFMEPWMGGERPVQFSASFNHSVSYDYNYYTYDVDRSKRFYITGVSLGLAKRLNVPDDYFQLSQYISYNYYDLKNYNTYLFTFGNGYSNAFSYTISLSRRSSGPNPIYPLGGSDFNITAKLTPPYSLFNNVDYKSLMDQRAEAVSNQNTNRIAEIDQQRFKWLEFYKLRLSGAWYLNLVDKLVLRPNAEFGYLGYYNKDRGTVPFERFFVGGDGMATYGSLDGREYVQMRGYPNQLLSSRDGDVIYNKFSLELRYPITLKPTASIYGLVFTEGANSYSSFSQYNPFDIKRSAGFGIRIFMPMFGLLGFDFGYGYDGINGRTSPHGWETHFIFGQQF